MKKIKKVTVFMLCATMIATSCFLKAEATEDYYELFFEHMKEYVDVEVNGFIDGLNKENYMLLGSLDNGIHIAYCGYEYNSVDDDYSGIMVLESDGYVLVTKDAYLNQPSWFGLYCFNQEYCYSIEDATSKDFVKLSEIHEFINGARGYFYTYSIKDGEEKILKAIGEKGEIYGDLVDTQSIDYIGKVKHGDEEMDIFSVKVLYALEEKKSEVICGTEFINPYYNQLSTSGVFVLHDEKVYPLIDAYLYGIVQQYNIDEIATLVNFHNGDIKCVTAQEENYYSDLLGLTKQVKDIVKEYYRPSMARVLYNSGNLYLFEYIGMSLDTGTQSKVLGHIVCLPHVNRVFKSELNSTATGIFVVYNGKPYSLHEADKAGIFNGIEEEILEVLEKHCDIVKIGDANVDDKVNMEDVIVMQRHIAGNNTSMFYMPAADMDAEGEGSDDFYAHITMIDVVMLQRVIAGIVL